MHPIACLCKEFYWNTTIPTHLHIIGGCFCTMMADLNDCNRDFWSARPKIFTLDPLQKKLTNPSSSGYGEEIKVQAGAQKALLTLLKSINSLEGSGPVVECCKQGK